MASEPHLYRAIFAARLEPQYAEGSRDHHALLAVIRRGDTLKEFQAFNSSCPPCGFVGKHATDSLEEDLRGCAEMERPRFLWVYDMTFVKKVVVTELMSARSVPDMSKNPGS